jgi:hypothetical protein
MIRFKSAMKQWYEVLFQNYAKRYDDEVFVKGTPGKVDIFGAKLGSFSRNDNLTAADFEMLVAAEK